MLGPLTKVFRVSIALRYVSQAWRTSKVVFVPKHDENGHVKAKDFRPTSLVSFLLKTSLVDRFMKNGPLIKHTLAASQYAYREGGSTETALHHLVSKVEVQLKAKGYAIGSFLDIEGAFDSTSTEAIKQAMIRHLVPEVLVDSVENMVADRNLTVSKGDITTEGKPDKDCHKR